MYKYYVLWTYVANFSSLIEVEATSPEHARSLTTDFFGEDFKEEGTVYVFAAPPVLMSGKNVPPSLLSKRKTE